MTTYTNGQIINAAVRAAQLKNNSDEAAKKLVYASAKTNPALLEALIWRGIDNAFGESIRRERAAIKFGETVQEVRPVAPSVRPAFAVPINYNTRVGAVISVNNRRFLNFPLPTAGNKRLGAANGAEIRKASEWYLDQGAANTREGMWLRAVGRLVPDNKIAESVVTEQQLAALREQSAQQKAA